ncbi:MAG: serine/threonine-protein kinase [Actinomycetota bacterium]
MSADPRIGTNLGDYRIESLLGRGGMSVVYLAEHIRLKRKAALKVLSPELAEDPTFRARFVIEWERLAQLDHPNIIPVFEAGESDGLLYIAMRYVRSMDLKGLIDQEQRLDPERAVNIIAQTASALDAAHEQNLVHRDVKPANILIALGAGPEGTDHVYLSDFGLTKHTESQSGLTKTGHFMGTLDYVAPEQISGKGVDGRTDQYALGCVLYQSLTGKVPYPREEETAALFAHLQDPPPRPSDSRPELPPEIDDVIGRSMAKLKEDRYATCGDMARAARAALGVRGSTTTGAQSPVARATETALAAPPSGMPSAPPSGAPAPPIPVPTAASTPGAGVGSPPPPLPMTPIRAEPARPGPPSGGNRKGLLVGGIAVAVIAAGVIAFVALGGGEDGEPNGGATGATGDDLQFASLVADDFLDNDAGWEGQSQNGIDRFPSLNERYRFEITDQAPANAFAVSVGGALGQEVLDQGVAVTTILVQKGGGGLLNSFGITCRYTGADGYYFLISTSGRYAIEKLVGGVDPIFLTDAGAKSVAIRQGPDSENRVEAECVGGEDGTPTSLSLIVNDVLVETITDDDPILAGTGGIAVTGQPGLVVDFDDFELGELVPQAQAG